jgi:N-acylneuraminate cytidylyltransferase/CMP-N,N'-diacetyllegionaminic acid synthase
MKLAAICARGGSKGVPRKNLRILDGKPLIAHTVEQALKSEVFDRVVVSTDDQEIADVARQYGAEVPFMRPEELARDDSPKWLVFQHLIREMEKRDGCRVDILSDLDTGTPLRSQDDIREAVRVLEKSDADVVITAYEADRNPYFNMVEWQGEYVKIVKPFDRTITRRQDAPVVFSLTPSIFAMKRDFIMQASHWSEGRVKIVNVPRERAIDIDSDFDFRLIEFLIRDREKGAGHE